MNTMKVWLLMGGLSILLVLMGSAVGGQTGAVVFFLIAMAMNFFGYFYSDTMAIKMTGSYPVSEAEAPELYAIIRRLSQRAGLPMPKVYIQPSDQPNAFATGRNPSHSAVAVTEGILRILNPSELEGVLAHELAHIKNRDILVGTIAAALAGAISMMANALQWGAIFGMGRSDDEEGGSMAGGLIMAFIAPIAAMVIQMAISRSREYMADATGAKIAGSPDGLSNALLKLESAAHRIPMGVSPATSHLFIVNPLSGESLARLFSTHPPIQDRVNRLHGMR
ncbi:Heat shock protein, Metallo peptidase, MEROPS family M48B [Desulforamulus reducens MI-1]|uniref:Protease HtpX homolog n=1 Tax=Desulforamulus reducens (strain ATCC BAA-1160 / DSM 100696 / MI-1) TaxID=349161 RepID=A4J1L4_DESRM|nr:zinc metalloprotease HtpX [Desulforamulus reducens]ABO48967.1 Heat shock protein, Metallo peptidase, MEROPS family M48B [Desulforamulus reducens MI-1]